MKRSASLLRGIAIVACLSFGLPAAFAIPLQWIGGNAIWNDAGATSNWNPADEPDADDEAIFNTAHTVSLGTSNSIQGLSMSNGINLLTAGFNLTVDGSIQLSNANTQLTVGGNTSLLAPDRIVINSGAVLQLAGGVITVDEEDGNGLIDLNTGATLVGTGTINLNDILLDTSSMVVNDGVISVQSEPLIPFTAPPVGTLVFNALSANSHMNLDGTTVSSVVNIFRNQTLDINMPLSDEFGGEMNLYHNSTFDMSAPWTLDVGTINIRSGFVPESLPNPAIPADVGYISGAALTQTGGTIAVIDNDGALQFNAPFAMSGGTLLNNGRVMIKSTATFASGVSIAGAGSLVVLDTGSVVAANGLNINLNVRNEGAITPAGNAAAGQLTVKDFAQTATGKLHMQIGGTLASDSDRLIIDGVAEFAGELRIGRLNAFVIKPGDSFTPITYDSHTGSFTILNATNLAGLTFSGTYGSTSLTITAGALYIGDADLNGRVDARDLHALAIHWLSPADWFGGDFDGNGFVNAHDLGLLALSWQAGVLAPSFVEAADDLGLPGSSVPEPASSLGVSLCATFLLGVRRRERA